MPEWKVIKGDGGAWSINQCKAHDGMTLLREMFPDAVAGELNFVLFSTSGVSGHYLTIEEVENMPEGNRSLTFVIVAPRIIRLSYGNCIPESKDDFEFLKKLRETSHAAVSKIGMN